jgi:hypothetical protein
MKQSWTKGLDKQVQKDVEQNFKESSVMRRRLVQLLLDRIESSAREGRLKDLYESPSWAYLQADKRGYERAMQEVIDLISTNVSKDE